MTAFEEMGVLSDLARAVEELEWTLPTDVQAEAIPLILGGGDVLMAAETGSGKTGAFCLPVLQIVWETLRDISEGKCTSTSSEGGGISSKWGFSMYDRGPACAVTPDGLRCQSRESKEWHGARSTKGVTGGGKYFFEAMVADEGLCRVGWSTQQASLDLGTDRFGFGFGGTGKKSNNKNFDTYGEPFGKADVIGCGLNLDDMEIRFYKNGTDLGPAFKLPAAVKSSTFFPAVVLKNAEMHFNFGDEAFKHEYPPVCVPISKTTRFENNPITSSGTESKQQKILPNAPKAIILEPSRELAEQTYNQIKILRKHLGSPSVKDLLIIGGVSANEQLACLESGVDIVVATPGRLEDFIENGQLLLSQCRFFVLDEADGLLKGGYGQLINKMHAQIPKITPDAKRLQMIVCSATLHDFEVKKLAEKLMHFPTWVDLKGEDAVPETVHHVVLPINPKEDKLWHTLLQKRSHVPTDQVHIKDNVNPGGTSPECLSEAVKILKGEYCIKAIDKLKMDQAMIFCRTKVDCDNLENYLIQKGGGPSSRSNPYSCVCLHGDRKPQERKHNLDRFKKKEVKFLICTDVAARGLDISGLPFMINITLPDDKANYVHRIGRVGRAERMGLAISFVSTVPEKVWYHGEWCPSRGRSCSNTKLTDQRGCCIWYNETQYLADIEENLLTTISQVTTDLEIPCNEFDGKVTYGQKARAQDTSGHYHLSQTGTPMKQLSDLESQAQIIFLKRHFAKDLIAQS